MNIRISFRRLRRGALLALLLPQSLAAAAALTLEEALVLAAAHDPWIERSSQFERALRERSIAAGALPDPMVSIGLANLPMDTFDFNQEPMTQARIGITQQLPRGDTRELRQRRLNDLGAQQPLERDNRRALVEREVTKAWLAAYRAQRAVALVAESRGLFDYLLDLTRSRYSSALGRTQQQDIVRAELELSRLEDRLQALQSARDAALALLGGWLEDPRVATEARELHGVSDAVPAIALRTEVAGERALDELLARRLPQHPAVLALEQRIAASRTDVEIAEQAYRPEWSINASYGYRDDAPMGEDRADFFSLGVAFDVPLFTASRQDPQVRAAVADSEALRTERALLLRELQAQARAHAARLWRLRERSALYANRLMPQAREQSATYLSAYRADKADFDDVVRARIDEVNARIEALEIEVNRLASAAELNYLLTVSAIDTGATP